MTARKAAKLALGLLFAALFIWLTANQIDPDELALAFHGARPGMIGVAFIAFCIGYGCRVSRWRLMLHTENPRLRWRNCAGPLLASFAANNVLPFRSGDLLRAFAFNRRLGISSGTSIATLFVERLLDLLMVLLLLGCAILSFGLDINRFAGTGGAILLGVALALLAVLLFPGFVAPSARCIADIIARLVPGFGMRLRTEIDHGLETLQQLSGQSVMVRLIAWSFAAWMAEGAMFWIAAWALPTITTPEAGWLALPVGTLATLIPGAPGYVGTFEYFTIKAMAALGNSGPASAAYALLVHMLVWLPPTVAGGIYFVFHPALKEPLVIKEPRS